MNTESNLTEYDKTRFLERGFVVVENTGHSLRLIDRDDARRAISIKWYDLPALRELITLALDDGPMVIGHDTSGQNAENAANSMRSACVVKVREVGSKIQPCEDYNEFHALVVEIIEQLESVTIDEQKQITPPQ
jgi:hypothetical protein